MWSVTFLRHAIKFAYKVAARSLAVEYGAYYAIWHERLIAMMGHPTLTIRNSRELRRRWAERTTLE